MRDIQKVYKSYLDSDGFFARKEIEARSVASRQKWAEKRNTNEQAFFVMLFAQFEDYVNRQCEKLITRRASSTKWAHRRIWETIDVSKLTRFPFRHRVALLTEKGRSDYATIINYYKIRCDIAHGNSSPTVSVITVANDLLEISRKIRIH